MPHDPLSSTFSALADPTRRAILAHLVGGERTVSELAEPFEMSLPAVTKHLKVLEHAGLISRSRHAQWRPCKLAPAPLRDALGWIETYRVFWDQNLDRLALYLNDVQANPSPATASKPAKQRKTSSKK
jgi:DNA-binding transcriptional ArsR family regulator